MFRVKRGMLGYRGIAVLVVAAALCCCSGVIANEYRIVPVTGWNAGFLDQADVDKLLGVPGVAGSKGDIRNANCNAIIAEVRRRADVCYPSALDEPYMSGLTPADFNALQAMINAAHDTTGGKKRIEVHCWIVVFRTGTGVVYSQHNNPADPDNYWMTRDDNGVEPSDKAFDPGHPNAEQYVVDVCMDLVNNFDIDGIHFDYIRFTGSTQGYNPTSIARYNARFNLTGQPESGAEQFKQWRRDQVTAVVRKVYAKVQAVKPWVKVSGSFMGGTPSPTTSTRAAFQTSAGYSVYSDWDSWIQEGIVDFAAPMTYFDMVSRPGDYTNWMNFQKDRKGNRLMVTDAGTYLNFLGDAIDMLKTTRDPSPAGNYGDGFGAYAYQSPYVTSKDPDVFGPWSTFSTQLLSQVTPTWADVPQMPWKTTPTKGHIGGTITFAPSNAWADGAQVRISGPESRQMRCDGTGFYAFIDLTPGAYAITTNYAVYEDTKTVTVNAAPGIANGDICAHTTDTTAPVVSNVQVTSISDSSAVISWNTDEISSSQVEYDSAPYYGQATTLDPVMTTDHSVTLQGLTPNTAYHFRVKSSNGAGLTGYCSDANFTTSAVQTTITVDDSDLVHCALSGSWILSGNLTYHYKTTSSGGTATWTPDLPRTGPYDVLVYYVQGDNRATNAQYTVNYSGGSSQVIVNQKTTVGTNWDVSLGTNLQFDAGSTGNVVLSNSGANGVVVADGVRFIYKGDVTAPVMTSALVVSTQSYVTSTTTLQASWSGYDGESAITKYRYAVGSSPGMADVKPWTDAGTATLATISGLSLQYNHTYYVSARAVNGAGLTSNPCNSTGVTVARIVTDPNLAKASADGDVLSLSAAVVTGGFTGRLYIEDLNRISGLRVESSTAVVPKQKVQVFGTLGIANNCERSLLNCTVIPGVVGPEEVKPVAMIGKSLGGAELVGRAPGITGGKGLNNVGLLVRIAGKVSKAVPDGFYLDDGSKMTDETGYAGVKVWTGVAGSAAENSYVKVTGVVSCRQAPNGVIYPQVLTRDID